MAVNRIFVPSDSTEYVAVSVTGTENGNQISLASTPVEVGLRRVREGIEDAPVTFHEAQWEVVNGFYYARILVGPEPGGIYLTVGNYNIWVKVYATPQLLIRKSPSILEIRPPETQ